jgi:hypothetical protein
VAQESGGLLVIDVSKPSAPKLLAADSLSNNPQDVALSGNYALLPGRYGSFSVVDVSDPANLHNFSTQVTGGRGISVNGSQAYLATSGAGIQTLDISNPTSPIATGGYRTPGYARKGVAQGDRLWIADAEAGLWSVPLTSMNQALAIQAGIAGGAMKLPATVRPSGHLQIPVLAPPMRNGMQAPRIATVAGSPCVSVDNSGLGRGIAQELPGGRGLRRHNHFRCARFSPHRAHNDQAPVPSSHHHARQSDHRRQLGGRHP